MRNSTLKKNIEVGRALSALLDVVESAGVAVEYGEENYYLRTERRIEVGERIESAAEGLFVLAHEFGHHLQWEAGFIGELIARETSTGFVADRRIQRAMERDAWERGEQFIPEYLRVAYWSRANRALKTYKNGY
jgi:hypothetical protein